MSTNQDFGVEQIFRADEFRADDPSPLIASDISFNFKQLYSNWAGLSLQKWKCIMVPSLFSFEFEKSNQISVKFL